jgi:hypothetical protein
MGGVEGILETSNMGTGDVLEVTEQRAVCDQVKTRGD